MIKRTRIHLSLQHFLSGAALVLASPLAMAGTIVGTDHDFSTTGWAGGQICIACHTPHNSNTTVTNAPLWNHAVTTATFTLYSSSTLNATMAQPAGVSKLCLSCHDGTVAVNSFGGTTGTQMITGGANLTNNLANDHPIGFTYNTALATSDGSLADPSAGSVTIGSGTQTKTGTIAATMLYGGQMECASCHDVHNKDVVEHPLLRDGFTLASGRPSQLCANCHSK